MRKYEFESQITGEVVENISQIIKVFFEELFKYGVINLRWKRL